MTHHRRGLSRVELLVVIVVALVTAGLILPAVQAARSESALKASQDNLRKIGLATGEYEKAVGRLPYGTFHDNNSASGSAHPDFHTFYSGFVAILPHLGEENLFRLYDPKLSPDDDTDTAKDGWSNKRVTESRPKVFLSPAMPEPEAPSNAGWSSYAWSGGNNDHKKVNGGNLTGGSGGWHDGAIVNAKQGPVKVADIQDGAAHTYLAGDAHYVLTGMVHPDRDKKFAGKPNTGNCVWGRGHYPRGFLSTNTPLNTHASKHSNPNMDDWYLQGAFGFRSAHTGGVNFVFCDGSVRFVKDSIPLSLHKALGSRAGGEVIADDDF